MTVEAAIISLKKQCSPCGEQASLEAVAKAVIGLERQIVRIPTPNKKIPGLGKCAVCKTELCIDDENLNYCPTCGQRLKAGRGEA